MTIHLTCLPFAATAQLMLLFSCATKGQKQYANKACMCGNLTTLCMSMDLDGVVFLLIMRWCSIYRQWDGVPGWHACSHRQVWVPVELLLVMFCLPVPVMSM
jgi:hypothetical protein